MGFFDSIKHAFNPEVKETFDFLYRQYYKGLKTYCSGSKFTYEGHTIDTHINMSNPSYDDMKRIFDSKDDIIRLHNLILEGEKVDADKKELAALQQKYPHAFVYYCNECLGGVIYNSAIEMPGSKMSKRQKCAADSFASSHDLFRRMAFQTMTECKYYGNKYRPIPNNGGKTNYLSTTRTSYSCEPKSVNDLVYPDVVKVLAKRKLFQSKEAELLAQLKQEDINIKFDDEVIDNSRRQEYYKLFLTSHSRKENDREYIVNNLSALDSFISQYIIDEYKELTIQYPLGTVEYKLSRRYGETDIQFKERAIKNKDSVKSLDIAKRKYNTLKRKYPKGLPALEKYYSYDDGKNSAELSLLEIIEREEEIAKFEQYADAHSSFVKWRDEQREFAAISRNLTPQHFGCYFYDIPLKGVKPDGTETTGEYRVWQHFYTSFYHPIPGTSISDDFAYLSERAEENSKFLTGGWNYKTSVYDVIWELIIAHKEKVGDISIVLATNGLDSINSMIFNDSKLEYLVSKINEANIPIYEGENELCQDDELTKHILIIEFITNNAGLKQTVEQIRSKYASIKPLISYISLRKGYDFEEVKQLEVRKEKEKQEQKAKEEAERRRIQQEKERQQREAEAKRKEQERREQELRELRNCVSSWYIPTRSTVHCFSLFNYYPVSCEWDADESEWEVRNTIWDFKANPNKPQSDIEIKLRHQRAVQRIMPKLLKLLNSTFGSERLSKLTLLCIPSSKKIVTERRCKDLSEILCCETGMTNGFDYVSVDSDGEAKHLGGTSSARYSIDSSFFKDKYIILFDDVITSGRSMEVFKCHLENVGAKVICGISIGRTRHERQQNNPIDLI